MVGNTKKNIFDIATCGQKHFPIVLQVQNVPHTFETWYPHSTSPCSDQTAVVRTCCINKCVGVFHSRLQTHKCDAPLQEVFEVMTSYLCTLQLLAYNVLAIALVLVVCPLLKQVFFET